MLVKKLKRLWFIKQNVQFDLKWLIFYHANLYSCLNIKFVPQAEMSDITVCPIGLDLWITSVTEKGRNGGQ